LVEKTGVCKISDFGISKRTDDINEQNVLTAMQGTVFWMAPEVVNTGKRGYNSKVDIWSVGCVVLEMWAGERPWRKEEAMAVIVKVRLFKNFCESERSMMRPVSCIPLSKLLLFLLA
jgi:mitogen-activated protein kinase kinase kinase ANP1